MSEQTRDLSSLFSAAVEISSESEREKFLDRSCGDDAELRKQLELLLSVQAKADGFLSSPPAEFAATDLNEHVDRPSLLKSLGLSSPVSQVALKEPAAEVDDPILRPSSPEMPKADADSRYHLQGEIARGGMGAILLGRDSDLGRTLAVKVLLESHKNKPEIVQRFVEEAQIGGQLQHPGIAPVYDIGQFSDQRPFFSMKLVKGQTLASLLTERTGSTEERGRFLGIFEQVCQTMAYAHSRGVVHRDLKPANIMVGAFGEVQVMDWGLAKVLTSGGVADERKTRDHILGQSMVQTLRSMGSDAPGTVGTMGSVGSDTQMGSVMGTPAYMPPEQALGEVDRLDERCDVFALGSMLCEILTGQPPYVHEDHREVYRMATRGKLENCFQRLDACGADAELISLAKQCLELEPADRSRNAGVLAERVAAYLESVEARLRETELQRAAEAAKAVEERKRRKVTWALAASIMLIFTVGGGSWMWASHQQAERRALANQHVTDALNEAKVHQKLAETTDLKVRSKELESAISNAQQATALAEQQDVDQSHRESADQLLAALEVAHKETKADLEQEAKEQQLLEQIVIIRVTHADEGARLTVGDEAVRANPDETSRRFATAFREAGYVFRGANTDEAAEQIRNSKNRESLIAGLDHWIRTIPEPSLRMRQAIMVNSGEWSGAAELARESLKAAPDNSQNWLTLAAMLLLIDDRDGYETVCHEMLEQFSERISGFDAGRVTKVCLTLPGVIDIESLPTRSFIDAHEAGLGSHWETRMLLAYRAGDAKSALDILAKVDNAELLPENKAFSLSVASLALHDLGETEQAQEQLNQARELVEGFIQQKRRFNSRTGLTLIVLREAEAALNDKSTGDWIERFQSALAQKEAPARTRLRIERRRQLLEIVNAADDNAWRISLRKALAANDTPRLLELAADDDSRQLSPELASWLGAALREAKEYDQAVEILKREQQKHPGDFWINFELSLCLQKQRKWEAALGYARAALAVRPDSTSAAWILVTALDDAGQEEEALQLFKGILARTEMSAREYIRLSENLRDRGWYGQAELTIRKAIKLEPENGIAWDRLSLILSQQGRRTEALETAQKLREVDPDYVSGYFRLAYALSRVDRTEEAAEAYHKYIERRPNNLVALNNLGNALSRLGQFEEAREVLEKALKINPNYGYAQRGLRSVIFQQMRKEREKGLLPAGGDFIPQGIGRQSSAELMKEYRETLELNPRDNYTRDRLGFTLLHADNQIEQAIEQFEIMLEYEPDSAEARHGLGMCYKAQGNMDAAILEFREAVKLKSEAYNYRFFLAGALHGKAVGATEGPATIPAMPGLLENAGSAEVNKPLLKEAVLEYRRAIALREKSDPDPPVLMLRALAVAYEQLGELDKAKEIRDKLPPAPETRIFGERGPSEAILTARGLREEGKIDEAIKVLEKALQDDTGDLPAIYLLGNLYKGQMKYPEAIAAYEKLPETARTEGGFFPRRIQEALADAYEQLGQLDKAKEIRSKLPYGQGRRGGSGPGGRTSEAVRTAVELRRAGKIDEAIEILEQALQVAPQDTTAISMLGGLYVTQKKYEQAIATYKKSLEIAPDDEFRYLAITRTMSQLHRYEEAHQFLKDALAADSSLGEKSQFQRALGLVLIERGEFEAALVHLRKALELPHEGTALGAKSGIVQALLQQGKLDEAETECRKKLDDQSDNARSGDRNRLLDEVFMNEGLAWCELSRYDLSGEANHLDKALQHARTGVEQPLEPRFGLRSPTNACLLPLGICQYRQEEFLQALQNLEKAYENVEYDPHTWVFLAMTHWQLDHPDEARQWLAKVEKHVQEHKPLPTLKRYLDEAKQLIR